MQAPISLKNKMLSNSLLPKTSTPIRARVISKDMVMNGTPINQLKLCVSPGVNKENLDWENAGWKDGKKGGEFSGTSKNGQEGKVANMISFAEFRFCKKQSMSTGIEVNEQNKLSPILSLAQNAKNKFQQSASLTANSFRSLTPNNLPKHHTTTAITTSKQKCFNPTDQNLGTAHLSITTPINQPLNQSSSSTTLRSSKSFSTLFQPRSKTPTRLGSMAFGSLSRKNNPSPGGGCGSENIVRKNIHRYRGGGVEASAEQMSLQMVQDSFISSSSFVQGRLMCMNNHGKAAKYRIKRTEEHLGEGQQFVYCSKCAIQMVQKGFSVQEIQVGVPHNMRQSNSTKPSFLSFHNNKPTTANQQQLIQRLKAAQHLKHSISQKLIQKTKRREIIQRKVKEEIQAIDCFYDSIVCYVEQQRVKDRQALEELGRRVWQTVEGKGEGEGEKRQGLVDQQTLKRYHEALDIAIRNKLVDSSVLSMINDAERHLQLINQHTNNTKPHYHQILANPQTRLFNYPSTIQQQFDHFVSFLDSKGKLSYKPFDQPRAIPKTNALRFSFQKALQTQHRQKSFISDNGVMNPLQEESEEDCDENSFSQEHMKQTAESGENFEQKQPFRTLFAEEDDILQRDEDEDEAKNDMYSPTFKSI